MSERYSKLFALPENLYAAGSPVIIAAGALLKDNQTGKVIAQLKMRNISQKPIKAAKVCIHPLDTVGNPLGEKIEYQYLDLSAARDEDFGQKAPVALPDASTRSFTTSVEEIVFADNSIWTATGEPWEVLDTPGSLRSIGDAELIKQFRLKYGNNCKNLPLLHKDLWYCACGELNRQDEAECHCCQKSLALLEQIDMDALRKERDTRVAAEKEQAEKEAAAAKAHAKKMGKIAAIVVPILVVLIVAAVIISNSVKKSNAYEFALSLVESGQYEDAIEQFAALGDYKDSAEQIRMIETTVLEEQRAKAYADAIALLEAKKYSEAYAAFEALGDYKDSTDYLEKCSKVYVLLSKSSSNGEITYEYADGVLIKETVVGKSSDGIGFQGFNFAKGTSGTAEYKYDAAGNCVEIRVYNDDGKLIKVTMREYDNAGNISKETTELPLHDDVDTYIYTYDDNGNMTLRLWYQNLTGTGDVYSKHSYEYDEHNQLISETTWYEWDIERTIVYENEYDSNGQLVKQSSLSLVNNYSETTEYEYDNNGNMIAQRVTNDYGSWEYTYAYDEFGNMIREFYSGASGSPSRTTTYTYGYIYTFE